MIPIVGILIVFPPFVGIPYKSFHVNAKLYFRSNLKLLNNVSIVVGILYSSIKSGPCKGLLGHEGQNCFPEAFT